MLNRSNSGSSGSQSTLKGSDCSPS